MPLTPVIATSLAASQVLDPLAEAANYRVQFFKRALDYSLGDLIADVAVPHNLGYSDYLNDVPEMFVTLHQDNDQLPAILEHLGDAHYLIWRGKKIVHAGWLMESDETDDDVVLYGYGYLAGLFWYLSDFDQTFTSTAVSEIVRQLWVRAKTLTNSMLGWVSTGAIEGAQDAAEGGGQIVLPEYPLYYKRILHVFKELATLGLSDTPLNVAFEITHTDPPVFNFWHNKGMRRRDMRLTYGDGGQIQSFRRRRSPIFHRNDVFIAGATPHTSLLRTNQNDAGNMAARGRRQEPLFLSWVQDADELERVGKLRLKHAMREDFDLSIRLADNSIVPPYGYGAKFGMADSIPVDINRGATSFFGYMLVAGYQVVHDGEEKVNLLLQEDRVNNIEPQGDPILVTDDTKYNAFPGIARMANGNLIIVYYKATDHATTRDGKVVAKISSNQGATWGSEITVYDHASLDVRGADVTVLSSGRLMVTLDTWNGTDSSYDPFTVVSDDHGVTWNAPVAIGHSFALAGVSEASRVVELPDGTLLQPMYGWDSLGGDLYVRVSFSTNGGTSWTNLATIVDDAGINWAEPYIQLLSDGTLLCLLRQDTGEFTARSVSTDNGATWSVPTELFAGQSKPAFVELPDGSLLWAGRADNLGTTVYRLSHDYGLTWTDAFSLDPTGLRCEYAGVIADTQYRALGVYSNEVSTTNADVYFVRFA